MILRIIKSLIGFILAPTHEENAVADGVNSLGASLTGKQLFRYRFKTSRGSVVIVDRFREIYCGLIYLVRYQENWLTGEVRGIIISDKTT